MADPMRNRSFVGHTRTKRCSRITLRSKPSDEEKGFDVSILDRGSGEGGRVVTLPDLVDPAGPTRRIGVEYLLSS